MQPIISHFQVKDILEAIKHKKEQVRVSLDLGRSNGTPLSLTSSAVIFPDGQKLSVKQLKKVLKHENKCYFVRDNDIWPVNVFSETTGWMRTLYPTKSAPTTLVSGFLMHRIKNIDPLLDTKEKIKAFGRIHSGGELLDTCFGLGYTAMELSAFGKVTTVEVDPAAVELAQLNPWSSPLFSNNQIEVVVGDLREVIKGFSDNQFSYVLHDPPSFRIGDELYSFELYEEFFRVMKNNGILFHYIGDPFSPLGSRVTRTVVERLKEVGFRNVAAKPEAFGVTAVK